MSDRPVDQVFPPEVHARVRVSFRDFENDPEPGRLIARPFVTGIFVVGAKAYSSWIVLDGVPVETYTTYEAGVTFLVPELVRSEASEGDWFHLVGRPTDLARGQIVAWGPPTSRTPVLIGPDEGIHEDPSDSRFPTPPTG